MVFIPGWAILPLPDQGYELCLKESAKLQQDCFSLIFLRLFDEDGALEVDGGRHVCKGLE